MEPDEKKKSVENSVTALFHCCHPNMKKDGGPDLSYSTGHFILKFCSLKCQVSLKTTYIKKKKKNPKLLPAKSGLFIVASTDDSLKFSSACFLLFSPPPL